MEEKKLDVLEELRLIVTAFNEAGIPFTLFGGWAVAAHGFVRYTDDIDVQLLRKDLDKAKQCLKIVGFIIDNGLIPLPSQGIEFYRMSKIVDSEVLVIDIQFLEEDSMIWKQREQMDWEGMTIWVMSIRDLIEMKKKSTRTKDRLDVEELERIEQEG